MSNSGYKLVELELFTLFDPFMLVDHDRWAVSHLMVICPSQ